MPSTPRPSSTVRALSASTAAVLTLGLSLSLIPATSVVAAPVASPATSFAATTAKPTSIKHRHKAVLGHAEDSGEVDPAYLSAAAAYAQYGEASLAPNFRANAHTSPGDTDGDGLTDDIDPDDDNDGIIDELDTDANGNGILDVNENPTPPTPPTPPTDDDATDDDPVPPTTIERYGSYQGQVSCNPTIMNGVAKLRSLFMTPTAAVTSVSSARAASAACRSTRRAGRGTGV